MPIMNTPNQLDKESFRRWLNRQPDTRVFDYRDNCSCLFASFAREELGMPNAWAGGTYISPSGGSFPKPDEAIHLPHPFYRAASLCFLNGGKSFFAVSEFRTELAKQLHRENL